VAEGSIVGDAVTEVTDPPDSTQRPASSTVAQVADVLRRQVLMCELMPGRQLRQDTLATALGVSRVPLREALRLLAGEGLLVHRPNQGYFVARLSADEFQQIVFLLDYLESELIRTVRWPTDDEVAAMRGLNSQIFGGARGGRLAEVTDLNRQLHFMIFRLSPKALLLAETERFWKLAQPYRLLHVASRDMERSAREHEDLIDALVARDRGLCLRITSSHRHSTMQVAVEIISATEEG
jgi:DNA-binding GntR family transcriptional regulator